MVSSAQRPDWALNEYLPLKQGLRLRHRYSYVRCFRLNEYLPLKQGLRLLMFDSSFPFSKSQWVSSIKTRIKTLPRFCLTKVMSLNEYLPLKQGLRHLLLSIIWEYCCFLNEYLPLKQGLRHGFMSDCFFSTSQWVSSIKTRIKTAFLLL